MKMTTNVERVTLTTYNLGRYEFNRAIVSEAKIKQLMESMQANGFDEHCPVVVSRSAKIADGQHRYEAARRLNIPVICEIYDKEFTLEEIIRMNSTSTKWNTWDYIRAYSGINANVALLKDTIEKLVKVYGWSKGVALGIATISVHKSNRTNEIISDSFRYNDRDLYTALATAAELFGISEYFDKWTKNSFIYAYSRARETSGFDYSHFLSRVKLLGIDNRVSANDFITEIEKKYNYNVKKADKLISIKRK